MSYFKPTIDETGIHVPDYVSIRNYLLDEFRRIFGQDLYLGVDTQDYQMISLFATAIDDVNALTIEAYNNRNPDYARGNSLDLMLPMNGISRLMSTNSVVTLTLSGNEGTQVFAGSVAIDTKGGRWIIQETVEITDTDATVVARAQTSGRVLGGAGTIKFIGSPTAGWISVNNVTEAIPGRNTETDAEVRARRLASVENIAIGIVPALIGSLYELEGVEKVRVYENTGSATDDLGIPGHSVCTIVSGGDTLQIARLIYMKKSPGCGLYGEVESVIADDFGNDITISFARPIDAPIEMTIGIKRFVGYSDDVGDDIKEALSLYISSQGIGQILETGLLWGVVLDQNPKGVPAVFSPTSIQMCFVGGTLSGDSLEPEYNEMVSCMPADITFNYV